MITAILLVQINYRSLTGRQPSNAGGFLKLAFTETTSNEMKKKATFLPGTSDHKFIEISWV
jgi:hypothetical protein